MDNKNPQPFSGLRLLFKILERVICNQLGDYMDSLLHKLSYGFRKAHSAQHGLLKLAHSLQKECVTAYPMTLLLQNLKLLV